MKWPPVPLKHLVSINQHTLPEDTDPHWEFRYVDIGTVGRGELLTAPEVMRFSNAPSRARRLVAPGDTIVSTVRTYLRAVWVVDGSTDDLVVSTGFAVLSPKPGIEPRFLGWLAQSDVVVDEIAARSTGVSYPAISALEIGNLRASVPTRPEQRAIVRFLDDETTNIDALVREKEQLLRLLEQKRRAIVTDAVTGGLDPSAPRRDADLDWLGEIPAHWDVWKIGHLAGIGNGSTPNRDNEDYWSDGSIPWLNSSVVNMREVASADQFVTETALRECHLPMVAAGSVLVAITGQGKTRGRAVVLSIDATINQHMAFLTPRSDVVETWYLRWVLDAAYNHLRVISESGGGTKGALTCEQLAAFRIPVPPLEEQRAIVAYVVQKARDIDALQVETERTIGLLKERRTALITAAVTGKIEVDRRHAGRSSTDTQSAGD